MSTVIKTYQKNELAKLYGVSYNTFVKWLQPYIDAGELDGWRMNEWYVLPPAVKKIFELLGEPSDSSN